jgi:hypothetical protein
MSALATIHILRDVDAGLDPNRVATQFFVPAEKAGISIQVDPDDFRAALERSGSRFASLVKRPADPHKALSRAVGNTKKGKRDDGVSTFWRHLPKDVVDGVASAALIRSRADGKKREWDGDHVATVSVRRTGGAPLVERHATLSADEEREIEKTLVRYAKERSMLTHGDVRAFLNLVLEKKLGGARVGGTECFILRPGDDEEALKLTDALALARVVTLPNEITPRSAARFAPAAHRDILDEVEKFKKECADKLRAVEDGEGADFATVRSRFETATALRQRAQMFAVMLGFSLDDVNEALAAAESVVRRTMVKIEPSCAAAFAAAGVKL